MALQRLGVRFAWLWLVPGLLSALALRYLVPPRWETGSSMWGWLARLGDEHPALVAVGFFVLFSLLIRQSSDLLPGASHLASAAADSGEREPVLPTSARVVGVVAPVLMAIAAALVLRTVVGQPYRVTSGSMLPTLEPSDYLLVNKLALGLRLPVVSTTRPTTPRRGDIIVFRGRAVGDSSQELLVKRVIGLPGDRIVTSGGLVNINGWPVPYCDVGRYLYLARGQTMEGRLVVQFLEDRAFLTLHTLDATGLEAPPVKPGEVFVLGDNRIASVDSRTWHRGVPLSAIEGTAWRIFGADRDGHLDPNRLFRKPGLDLHLPGVDVTTAEQRIARCLKDRPRSTWPPEFTGSS